MSNNETIDLYEYYYSDSYYEDNYSPLYEKFTTNNCFKNIWVKDFFDTTIILY